MDFRDRSTCYSSGDWKIQNDSAVVASGCLLPNSQSRRITIRSSRSQKCPPRRRKKKDCYCTSRPVPTRINFHVNRAQCYHTSENCPFPDQDDGQSYMYEPIESISLYNTTMLQKARELIDYEPSTLFLRKLKAEACKTVLRESENTRKDCTKYTRARQAYEQYIVMRNEDQSLVQPCMCKYPNPNQNDGSDTSSKQNDANIQTLCSIVEQKCAATETNNRCCPKCCKCQKDKSTTADLCKIEEAPKQQECKPKQQECEPKRQECKPKQQECEPKRQECEPKQQENEPTLQGCIPKQQEDKPKPPEKEKSKPPEKEKSKEIFKPKATVKKPKPSKCEKKTPNTKKCEDCGISPPLLSPEIRDQQRFKKQSHCEDDPCKYPHYFCNCPKGTDNVKDLQLFRNDYYFETHSVNDFIEDTPKHDCVHLVNFNEKCQPYYINADPYGYSRCYVCNRAMTTVQNLAAKKPMVENVETYRKSKLSNLSITKNTPIIIEPTRIQITNKSQKVMAKLPPYCEEAGNFIKTKYRRPVPINSFALRFQKGVYNN